MLSFPITMHEGKGDLPVGVCPSKWKDHYEAKCGDGVGGQVMLCRSKNMWECFRHYADYKKIKLIEAANKYKDEISETIYNNLINYEVVPYPTKSSYQTTNPIL
jgi:hypothetical protein